MAETMKQEIAQGPPYPPHYAGIGGEPTATPDIPISAVFIFLYLCSAVTNITIFQTNRRKGHKFLISGLLVGFSMARVLTCCLRIGWATNHHNVSLAIAANIFVNAGILIVYIVNVIFAQRILRARHPTLGWNRALKIVFTILYCLIGVALVLVIVLTVMSFYTLDPSTLSDARWIQRGAILYLLIIAFMPLVIAAVAYAIPRTKPIDHFGHGGTTSKAIILVIGAGLCTLIAGFKAGINWSAPRPIDDPAWYDSKASFYCFNFMLEVIILITYISTRVDQRFHVPNGSSKRRTFAKPGVEAEADTESGEEEGQTDDTELGLEKKRTDSGLDQTSSQEAKETAV